MRIRYPFNRDWLYAPQDLDARADDSRFQPVTLPHTNVTLPYHNFDVSEFAFISTYRKRFTLPDHAQGRRVFVDFDGAMIACTVTINGRIVGEHEGGYLPFSFDLTEHLQTGENVLQVRLDSTERPDIPPNGYIVDYLTFGGIYRDVRLRIVDSVHIDNVFVRPENVLTQPRLSVDIRVKNSGGSDRQVRVRAVLRPPYARNNVVLATSEATASVPAGESETLALDMDHLTDIRLWTLDQPHLYMFETELYDGDHLIDTTSARFGFREAVFRADGFYLNGEHVKLIGLNRHQTYPYIGAAAPARLQRKDADILKYELGVNIVRTSHYPQSRHFLNRCDQIGLLVFEEIPGWQFIGDSDWKALSLRDVQGMIERDRNHPSIVLWGVRINESWDDEALYRETNALAHRLDPTRQTGGVRNFLDSQFLEDVFTYNDFSNTIVEPTHTPHLVTEFSGHMFPTKTFDNEERQVEHALRHARIQDKQLGMQNVAGAIGWCAFDYNTHRELGSGDRICYHGVMDIFRLPKFAAYFYESQIAPSVRPVVRVASFWTMGDRSEGGNDPLVIFSNCDEIEVYIGEELHGRYAPDREHYPNLAHPPFVVPGLTLMSLFGRAYQDLRVVGLIAGKAAAEQRIAADGVPARLELQADDDELYADGADMTRLVIRITDRYGNRLPYAIAPVTLEIEGEGALIGENPFPLVGGQGALYVRAGATPGTITITARVPRLAPATVTIANSDLP